MSRESPCSSIIGRTNPFDGLDQAHIHFNRLFIDITLFS